MGRRAEIGSTTRCVDVAVGTTDGVGDELFSASHDDTWTASSEESSLCEPWPSTGAGWAWVGNTQMCPSTATIAMSSNEMATTPCVRFKLRLPRLRVRIASVDVNESMPFNVV
jgi:hypothetical protein